MLVSSLGWTPIAVTATEWGRVATKLKRKVVLKDQSLKHATDVRGQRGNCTGRE